MSKVDMEEDIRNLIARIIESDPSKIGLETNLVDELGADSMMALEIMFALEKKYDVDISESDLPKMTTLKEIIELTKVLM